jgi:predicted butyrate kinase (DUF1464 family)
MPRVIGIDPGTISLDVCGLEDGRVFLDRSFPTSDALADPSVLVGLLESAAPLDLVAGPSGYGMPLIRAQDLSDADLRLAYLPDLSRRSAGGAKADESKPGGILGLRALMRALARSSVAVVLTPGVVHLPTVPAYRKVNRVDMGTADKVCAVALAVLDETRRRACDPREVSFILLERRSVLGGSCRGRRTNRRRTRRNVGPSRSARGRRARRRGRVSGGLGDEAASVRRGRRDDCGSARG